MSTEMDKPFLPFDIITNILTRLPIKSILKFQCVCKEWKNLFKTQSFISQNTLHTSHQNPFLLINAYDYMQERSIRLLNHNMQTHEVLNTHFITREWKIMGSSNGLLCVQLLAHSIRSPISYLVWNPVTNEVREVPQIIYDYCQASRLGFGYSSVVNDYKIVRFYHHSLLRMDEIESFCSDTKLDCVQVYSLRTNSWKELDMGDLQHVRILHQPATCVNGTMFWYGCGSRFEMLIAFDIATEVFTITPIDTLSANVDEFEYGYCPKNLYEYGNKLAMCRAFDFVHSKTCNMYLWVIEEGDSESVKSYTCTETYKFGPILYGLRPSCIWRNQIVCRCTRIVSKVEGDNKDYLYLFNLSSKEWKKFPNFSCASKLHDIFNYEKSLVSICNT